MMYLNLLMTHMHKTYPIKLDTYEMSISSGASETQSGW